MPQFPSAEWMDEFCEHFEAQEGADEVAEALDGVYRFVVEPAGPLQERCEYDVEIRPNGGAPQASRVETPDVSPRLTMTANYERWKQLITGRLDVGMALMLRRLKVSGDVKALMRDVGTTKPLMRALGDVETEWLG